MPINEEGICSACRNAEAKEKVDWSVCRAEFDVLCDGMRGSDNSYHCVVPFSGGKDSASIAHRLKFEYGLNPLLVCYGQLMQTEVGRHNFEEVRKQGFDIINWAVNGDVSRKLCKRFLIERGAPKLHYNAGVNSVPLQTALNFNIPVVFYAEHGESEYGGLVLDEESQCTRNLTEVLEHQIGDDPRNWAVAGLSEQNIAPYIMPNVSSVNRWPEGFLATEPACPPPPRVTAYYWSYFHKWDPYENYQYCREHMDFQGVERSDGNFVGWDSIDDKIDDLDFFMMFQKFGFGRATRQASRMIHNGHLTREKGLEYVRQYDGEFPHMYLGDILEYLDMSLDELKEIIELHKNPEIWDGDQLRHPPR